MNNIGKLAKPTVSNLNPLLLIMGLALTSCTNAGSNSTDIPQDQNAKNKRADITSVPPYFATFAEPDYPTPDTTGEGKFIVQGRCIIFMSRRGEEYLPVLPYGTQYAPGPKSALLQVQGRDILANTLYTVAGAPSEYPLTKKPPADCPRLTFLIGEVS